MKRPLKYIVLVVLLIAVCIILLTPVGPRLRGYMGRLMSYTSVKLKAEKTIPENTYNWEIKDLNGKTHAFQENKGKVVFLNLWATWCKPCLKEMPDIQALYNDYSDKVSFMLVSEEESIKVKGFVSKKSYRLPFYLADDHMPEIFKSTTIPTTYIISKQGKIVMAENGAIDWNSEEVRRLLDKLIVE